MIDEKSGTHSITAAISEMVYQFERDYRAGLQPVPELYAKTLVKQPEYWRLLFELLHSDLELNIRDGHERSVSQYLQRLPDAAKHTTEVLSLIEFEVATRVKAGQQPSLEMFQHVLPTYKDQLVEIFQQASLRCESELSTDNSAPGIYDTLPAANGPADSLLSKLQTIGRYRLVRRLGKGGMGSVYEAEDPFLKRRIAIKVPQLTGNKAKKGALLQRFLQEGRAAATLHHPNLCPVFDAGEVNGIPFLAMSYISGEPLLKQVRKDKPWDPAQATDLVRQLALALEAAHEKGVIHRDIKPANIILNEKNEPIIIDFGLATPPLGEDERITDFGDRFGTIAYMSPEQTSGDPLQVSKRSDIYSLGVVLYELLTGKVPFQGSQADVLVKIRTHTPVSPKSLRPEISCQLEETILRAIAKKPEDRFASMNDFAKALETHRDVAISSSLAGNADLNNSKRGVSLGRLAAYLAAVVLIGLLIFELFQLIRISTSNGTIVIDVKDPSAVKEIKIDGNTVQLTALGKKYTVTAGKHRLEVGFNGDKIESKEFTISQGESKIIAIAYDQSKEQLVQENWKMTTEEIAKYLKDRGIAFDLNEAGTIRYVNIPKEKDGKTTVLNNGDFKVICSIKGIEEIECSYAALTIDQCRIICECNSLVSLSFAFMSLSDADLSCISNLKNLKEVGFWECSSLTDDHIKHLGAIEKLEGVGWAGIKITGKGLEHLGTKKLHRIVIQGTFDRFESDNIRHLNSCISLKHLVVQGDRIDPSDFKYLVNIKALEKMSVTLQDGLVPENRTELYSFLKKNNQLHHLEILDISLGKEDMARIADSCRNLRWLRCKVAMDDNASLFVGYERDIKYLSRLDITGSQLSSEWYKELDKIVTLESLVVNDTAISSKALNHLAKSKLKEIHLDLCKHIKDEDLKLLLDTPKLRHVNLVGSSCTPKAIDELRTKLLARDPSAKVIDK